MESFHLLSQHRTFHLNSVSLMGGLLSSGGPLVFQKAVTCILPQMLPITDFPNPDIKGNLQLLRVRGIPCPVLLSKPPGQDGEGRAEKDKHMWDNEGRGSGDTSVTKSVVWLLHRDFSIWSPYSSSKTIWTLLAENKAKNPLNTLLAPGRDEEQHSNQAVFQTWVLSLLRAECDCRGQQNL